MKTIMSLIFIVAISIGISFVITFIKEFLIGMGDIIEAARIYIEKNKK